MYAPSYGRQLMKRNREEIDARREDAKRRRVQMARNTNSWGVVDLRRATPKPVLPALRNRNRVLARTPNVVRGVARAPEMNTSVAYCAVHQINPILEPVPFTTASVSQATLPVIGIGTGYGAKTGRKCILKKIVIKGRIYRNWKNPGDKYDLYLVRKAMTNRTEPAVNDIWQIGGPDDLRMRNKEFTEQYTILKHWQFINFTAGEDNATYPIIGLVEGFLPGLEAFEYTTFINDEYENDSTNGKVEGAVGASYSLWAVRTGINDGYITTGEHRLDCQIQFSYIDP